MNLPNKITLVRIFMIPIFVAIFFITAIPGNYLIAAVVFLLAALTDALDGYIARSRGLVTNLGKFLDPIADKVLVSTAMILLLCMREELFFIFGDAETAIYIATAVCVAVIMARELIISAFRQIAATTGLVMAADKLGKFKTIFQDASVALILGGANFATSTVGAIICYVGFALFAVATLLTVISGVSYVVKNKQVLKTEEK